jgi:hypothetical protein
MLSHAGEMGLWSRVRGTGDGPGGAPHACVSARCQQIVRGIPNTRPEQASQGKARPSYKRAAASKRSPKLRAPRAPARPSPLTPPYSMMIGCTGSPARNAPVLKGSRQVPLVVVP